MKNICFKLVSQPVLIIVSNPESILPVALLWEPLRSLPYANTI